MTDADRLDALVPLLRQRDRAAFVELYDLMAPQLLAFARGAVGDPHQAEDVVQDVFVRFTRHARRFRGDGRALLAWLYTATRRRCADVHRRRGRRPEIPTAVMPEQAAYGSVAEAVTDPDVLRALGQLTEAQRAAILLRRVASLEGHEVAEILGIERDAVYALCARGEARLRLLLAPASDTAPVERQEG